MKFIISTEAWNDIDSIYNYYSTTASEKIARKICLKIIAALEQIEKHPKSGAAEQQLSFLNKNYRRVISGNYKIIYRVSEKEIFVVTVFDCRQDPEKLSKKI